LVLSIVALLILGAGNHRLFFLQPEAEKDQRTQKPSWKARVFGFRRFHVFPISACTPHSFYHTPRTNGRRKVVPSRPETKK